MHRLFNELLAEPFTPTEEAIYSAALAELRVAMSQFDERVTELHKRVMARRTASNKSVKVLQFKGDK